MINCLNILILILFINLGVGKIDVLISIMNYYFFPMICFHKYNPSSMKITFYRSYGHGECGGYQDLCLWCYV